MDKVFIEGLTLYTLIGVYDFERHEKQRVVVDLEMSYDLSRAAKTDSVNDTLDYGKVAQRLGAIAEEASFELLEALANNMIQVLFEEFDVTKLKLKLSKPDILKQANNVGILIERERPIKS
uniref:dihydroneopterin aldolase n=1 Tax=Ningiella ruwaisensis TaxID=2364274 RepID=UPI0010A0413A|nr:dihydroneopterin aldolase [Ningiella ruwaisensis]